MSDINLTMSTYTHLGDSDKAEAISKLPPIKIQKPKQAKTGTADVPENVTVNSTENSVKTPRNTVRSVKGPVRRNMGSQGVKPCNDNGLTNHSKLRVLGLEPRTYGLKEHRTENLNTSQLDTYTPAENRLTANLTENAIRIQQDLARIINRWPSLPKNVRAAILVLIGSDTDD